ncbi:MAG TPA: hypothetical protein VN848_05165 [Gemmatimonadales bacterium]|nr:hypothetical protein [Gemmatimonadales bacterium]
MTRATATRLRVGAGVVTVGLLVWAVALSSTISILAAFAVLVTVGLFLSPKPALAVIGVFLLAQPLLVNLAGGSTTPLGLALHRLHQAFAIAAGARVAALMWWGRLAPALRPWLLLLAGFVVLGVVSGVVQHVPVLTVALGAFLAIKFPLFLLLAMTIPWSERDCERILRVALWLGPLLVVSGFVIGRLPPDVRDLFIDHTLETESFGLDQFKAMQSIFTHPAIFGWAVAVTGCYGVAALLVGQRGSGGMAAASIGAGLVGILASLRRKPLVALPIAAVYGVMRFVTGVRRWVVLAVFGIVAVAVARVETRRLETEIEDAEVYIDPTTPLAPRVLLYITGVDIANARFPLGAGFGRFGGYASTLDYSPLYDEYGLSGLYGLGPNDPYFIEDTYWPHIAAETGWLGAAILLALYLLLVERCARVALRAVGPATKTVAIAASLALLEGLIESAAGPMFEEALFAFAVGIPLGITLVRGLDTQGPPEETAERKPAALRAT